MSGRLPSGIAVVDIATWADEHGVDLGKVTWVLSGDEHVAEFLELRPVADRCTIQLRLDPFAVRRANLISAP